MRTGTRVQALLIGLTVLALGAGVAAGMLASRATPPASGNPTTGPAAPIDRTPLVQELNLTPEQRDRMREIWEGVRGQVHETFEDAKQLQRQRDDALVALLTDEQKAQFEKISQDFKNQFDDLAKKRDKVFQSAVKRTKQLLNDEQRKRYEAILKNSVGGPDGGHEPGMPPPPPTATTPPPTTAPPRG
jgi:Spy/CpxP family protein refolding chaperone